MRRILGRCSTIGISMGAPAMLMANSSRWHTCAGHCRKRGEFVVGRRFPRNASVADALAVSDIGQSPEAQRGVKQI
ncbi:MAG: hypothetical protein AB7L90_06730 [Hyphomicrobiaceae bacterium]